MLDVNYIVLRNRIVVTVIHHSFQEGWEFFNHIGREFGGEFAVKIGEELDNCSNLKTFYERQRYHLKLNCYGLIGNDRR